MPQTLHLILQMEFIVCSVPVFPSHTSFCCSWVLLRDYSSAGSALSPFVQSLNPSLATANAGRLFPPSSFCVSLFPPLGGEMRWSESPLSLRQVCSWISLCHSVFSWQLEVLSELIYMFFFSLKIEIMWCQAPKSPTVRGSCLSRVPCLTVSKHETS